MNSNINFLLTNKSIAAHVTVRGAQVEITADSASDLSRTITVFCDDAKKFEHETYSVVSRSEQHATLKRDGV
jgi:hypothetical protein